MPEEDFTTKFGRSMRKVSIHIIIFAIGGAIVSAFIFSKPVLSGERSHDFGIVNIADSKASVQHTFHLTNTTDKTIDIQSMKPDCGCTTVTSSAAQVGAKSDVDIIVTLEISRHGPKKSLIILDLGDSGTQVLTVQATGKMSPRLFSPMDRIVLVPNMRTGQVTPVAVPVYANVFGSNEPLSGLSTTSPLGVEVRFGGWSLKHQAKDSSAPTEWEGQIMVSRGSGVFEPGSELQLELDGVAEPLRIPIVMAQSLTGAAETRPAVQALRFRIDKAEARLCLGFFDRTVMVEETLLHHASCEPVRSR